MSKYQVMLQAGIDTKSLDMQLERWQNKLTRMQVGKVEIFNTDEVRQQIGKLDKLMQTFGAEGGASTKQVNAAFDNLATSVRVVGENMKMMDKENSALANNQKRYAQLQSQAIKENLQFDKVQIQAQREKIGLIQQEAIYENKKYDQLGQMQTKAYVEDSARDQKRYQEKMSLIQQEAIAENKKYDQMSVLQKKAYLDNLKFDQNRIKLLEQYNNKLDRIQSANKSFMNTPEVKKNISELQGMLQNFGGGSKEILAVRQGFDRLNTSIVEAKGNATGFIGTVQNAAKKVAQWAIATGLIYGALNQIRNMVDAVKELDSSLLELRKVTDLAGSSLKSFTDEAFRLAESVGRTGTEAIDAVTEFARAGYNLTESMEMARAALTMTNVAEGIDTTSEAASVLISVLKGYKLEASDAARVTDLLNEVSNTAAIDFDNLADGLRRTSGTLSQTGTSVEELAGLLTGGFEQLRDIEMVSSGLNMISQRLRGVTEDGEAVYGLTAKLQKSFKELAGIDIIDPQTNGLRSTYDILSDMAKVWPELNKTAKGSLITQLLGEEAAGNRQIKVLNAILGNWEGVTSAVKDQTQYIGSAAKENEKFLNSIEGKTKKLESSFQELAHNTISSEFVKSLIDLGTIIIKLIDQYGLLNVATVAFSAFITTKLLTAIPALNMVVGFLTSKFVLLTGAEAAAAAAASAFTLAIGALIAVGVIFLIKKIDEANVTMSELHENFMQLKSDAVNEQDELKSLAKEYEQLANKQDKNSEDLTRLLDIQTILRNKYGVLAEGADIYTAAVEGNTDAIQKNIDMMTELAKHRVESFLEENRQAYEDAKSYLEEGRSWMVPAGPNDLKYGWNPEQALMTGVKVEDKTPEEIIRYLGEQISLGNDLNGTKRRLLDTIIKEKNASKDLKLQFELQQDILTGLDEAQKGVGKSAEEGSGATEDWAAATNDAIDALSKLSDAMSGIMSDYEEYGQLTLDQVSKIKESFPDSFGDILYTENDQIKLNTEALRENILAQAKDVVVKADRAYLIKKTAENLANLTIAEAYYNQVLNNNIFSMDRAKDAAKDREEVMKDAESAYQDLLKITIEMIRQQRESEKQALEDQLDGYKKIIDARKKILDTYQKEKDYQDELNKKNKEINDIQSELLEIQFDDSEEARAKRLQLESDLADKEKDLSDYQYDYSIENQKDALDEEYDNFKDNIDDKIKVIESYLSQSGQITADAIAMLNNRTDGFYQSLIDWNRIYGSGIDQDVIGKWQQAMQYLQQYQAMAAGVTNPQNAGTIVGGGSSYQFYDPNQWGMSLSDAARAGNGAALQQVAYDQMHEQMAATESVRDKQSNYSVFYDGAEMRYKNKSTGKYVDASYYSGLPRFHDGGIVPGLPNMKSAEIMAKLMPGEFISTPKQIDNFVKSTLPNIINNATNSIGDAKIELNMYVDGNVDKTVLPDIKKIALEAYNEALKLRGLKRNAMSFGQ